MPVPTPAEAKAEIRSAAAVSLTTACASLGVSQATGSRMIAAGKFPVPIIRMGSRVVVPTEPLLKLLHIDAAAESGDTSAEGNRRAGKASA
jgi:hypothetical protein